MKFPLLLACLLPLAVRANLKNLQTQARQMGELIGQAKKCVPAKAGQGVRLCSGATLPLGKIADCQGKSLRRWQSRQAGRLSPRAMRERGRKLTAELNWLVGQVRRLEKSGKKKAAASLGAKLSPIISLAKRWQEARTWLADKDIYHTIYHHRQRLGCSPGESEKALVHLFRLKNHFPEREKMRITTWMRQSVRKKKARLFVRLDKEWRGLDEGAKQKRLAALRPKAFWDKRLRQKKISPSEYDGHVLSGELIRLLALQESKPQGLQKWLLEGRLAQIFPPKIVPPSWRGGRGLSLRRQRGLWWSTVAGRPALLDTGAQKSVMAPKVALEVAKGARGIGLQTLQMADGKLHQAAHIALARPVDIGGLMVSHTRWSLADLGLPGIEIVLGMDQFQNLEFVLRPREGLVEFAPYRIAAGKSLPLRRFGERPIDALEFACPGGKVFRLDSGSQVAGDIRKADFTPGQRRRLARGTFRCGPLTIGGKFHVLVDNAALFSRHVVGNLGLPWLLQFEAIHVSLAKGLIAFSRQAAVPRE